MRSIGVNFTALKHICCDGDETSAIADPGSSQPLPPKLTHPRCVYTPIRESEKPPRIQPFNADNMTPMQIAKLRKCNTFALYLSL